MGFLDGKFSVFRLGLSKNSDHSTHPRPANPSRTHDHKRRHRKRRFHVSPRALGTDLYNYSLATPSPPTQWPETPWPTPQPPADPPLLDPEPKTLSDREIAQQPARSGMRICAWILWIVLVCIHYKKFIAIWVLAAHSWPNLQ
jgi:hypothetical protein